MPWLVSIFKSIGAYLLPHLLEKIKDWFLAWYEKRRLEKEQAEARLKESVKQEQQVIEAVNPEMTDEERVNAQESSWRKYVSWFGRKRL